MRLTPLLVLAAAAFALPLGATPALACNPPAEGPPQPCCTQTIQILTVEGHTISITVPKGDPSCD
jgi:hypothetical protein